MNPPPPITATCILSPLPDRVVRYGKERDSSERRPGSPPSESAVDGGHAGQHLVHLAVGHVRMNRQADMPGRQLFRHRKRRAGVLREHRLAVQWKIVDLSRQFYL